MEPSDVVDQLRKVGQRRIGAAARTALALAEEEAIRGKAATVETEHLLLGLLRQADGAAALAMNAMGLDIDDLRRVMESLSPAAPGPSGPGERRVGAGLIAAIQGALNLSAHQGRRWVETADLLQLLVRPGCGSASLVLDGLRVDRHGLIGELSQRRGMEPVV